MFPIPADVVPDVVLQCSTRGHESAPVVNLCNPDRIEGVLGRSKSLFATNDKQQHKRTACVDVRESMFGILDFQLLANQHFEFQLLADSGYLWMQRFILRL